ncbi:MAG: hypothetical protein KJ011_04625 [Burkholderiaceae bacterium]|nr:hypothetical protein [Burkholderiaceae bacterium]
MNANLPSRVELARLITRLERGEATACGAIAVAHGVSRVVGITGIPGAGKSTLVDALVALYRLSSSRVGVIAVDPSSPVTGGALLGDRVRMNRHASDEGVFIRSMGSRGRLDGLAPTVQDSCRLLAWASYDPILIETVGVGQIELGVVECCDVRVLVLAPAWGDYIQAAKAGLVEMVDIVVVNKADLPGADTLIRELKQAVLRRTGDQPIKVVAATASDGERGVGQVYAAIDDVWSSLSSAGLRSRRLEAIYGELMSRVAASFAAGPTRSVIEDGTAKQFAETVYDGKATMQEAANMLFGEAIRRLK